MNTYGFAIIITITGCISLSQIEKNLYLLHSCQFMFFFSLRSRQFALLTAISCLWHDNLYLSHSLIPKSRTTFRDYALRGARTRGDGRSALRNRMDIPFRG